MWKKYRAGGCSIYTNDTITFDPLLFLLAPLFLYNNASYSKLGVQYHWPLLQCLCPSKHEFSCFWKPICSWVWWSISGTETVLITNGHTNPNWRNKRVASSIWLFLVWPLLLLPLGWKSFDILYPVFHLVSCSSTARCWQARFRYRLTLIPYSHLWNCHQYRHSSKLILIWSLGHLLTNINLVGGPH